MLYAGVIIVFNEKGEILVVRRSPAVETYVGHWCFPGGGADEGETAEECAVRETLEETSLKVNPLTLIYLDTIIKDEDKEIHFFVSSDWEGEVEIDWESDDYQWVHPAKLRELQFIPTPESLIKILEIWSQDNKD
jgi:mutator protein MutT